ncbi:type II secretion system protein N [Chitinimonas sp.]|uniref:type II secretion system protein N n=1 Tax=Chitinimonas sp. TaxID=1934313 RepID=UPI0035B19B08
MIVSLPRSIWFYRCLNGVLILLLAWLLAGLIWQLIAPAAKPPLAAPQALRSSAPLLDMSPLNRLFSDNSAGVAAPSSLSYKLRGVIAAQGEAPAAAMFEVTGRPALVAKTGDELEGGVRLVEVASDHALVDNHGRRERIELDSKPAANGIVPATAAVPVDNKLITPVNSATQLTPPVPVEPAADERRIARAALVGGLGQSGANHWAKGLADGSGGIALVDAAAQPVAGVLGLQNGDVLTAINNSPLQQKGDVALLYATFSRASKVKLDIVRNGAPLTLLYRIENQAKP